MNPVRLLAETLRKQFNFLKSMDEIDGHYMDYSVEDLRQRSRGIGRSQGRGWTKQDLNRIEYRDFCFPPDLPSINNLNSLNQSMQFARKRMGTRLVTAIRLFQLSRKVTSFQQVAIQWLKTYSEYLPCQAIVVQMSIIHSKWIIAMRDQLGDIRDFDSEWMGKFNELFDWIDQIEAQVALRQQVALPTTGKISRQRAEHAVTQWVRKHRHKYANNTEAVMGYIASKGSGSFDNLYGQLNYNLREKPLSSSKKPT